MSAPRLALEDVVVRFRGARRALVTAVDGASLDLFAGRTLALLGESGCGKSTLARVAAGHVAPDAGRVRDDGREVRGLRPRFVQLVFQDPAAALDPLFTVARALEEPLVVQGARDRAARRARIERAAEEVDLSHEVLERTPDALSGGQKARVVLARALLADPQVLLLDEPFSALDVSVSARLWARIAAWQQARGAAVLLVTHDARTALAVASEVAIMRAGRVLEVAPADRIVAAPAHPYTRALLEASPGVRVTSVGESG